MQFSKFGKIKKTTREGSGNAYVLYNNCSTFVILWEILDEF